MLPFPRILKYANTVDHNRWYNGTELIAFDSLNYNGAGFQDYVGNNLVTGVYVNGGTVPVKSTKPIFSGTGIQFGYGGYIARNTMDVSTWLNSGWTVDYWTCQSQYSSAMQLSCTPIAVYTNTSFNSYTNRFLVAEANNVLYQWNNNATGTSWNQSYADLTSTTYVHFALVYDGNTFKVFTNGKLQQTINKGAFGMPTPSNSLTYGILGQGGYVPTKYSIIDRYRLRKGAIWSTDFNTNNIY